MDLPHPSHHHHHHHHHHRLHLHLDPGHHHRIHIHLCHHTNQLLHPAAPCAHHHQQASIPPHSLPYPPTTAPWHPEAPLAGRQGEVARDSEVPAMQAEQAEDFYLEEEEDEDEEPVFVLTEEWAEFFAKADAKRKLAKQQKQKKNRRK